MWKWSKAASDHHYYSAPRTSLLLGQTFSDLILSAVCYPLQKALCKVQIQKSWDPQSSLPLCMLSHWKQRMRRVEKIKAPWDAHRVRAAFEEGCFGLFAFQFLVHKKASSGIKILLFQLSLLPNKAAVTLRLFPWSNKRTFLFPFCHGDICHKWIKTLMTQFFTNNLVLITITTKLLLRILVGSTGKRFLKLYIYIYQHVLPLSTLKFSSEWQSACTKQSQCPDVFTSCCQDVTVSAAGETRPWIQSVMQSHIRD